jgi:Dyp-type peroxidase family
MTPQRREPPDEPLLDGDEIQGNAVPGFMKPFMGLAVLTVDDKAKAKAWFGEIAGQMTTLEQTMESRVKVRSHRGLGPERIERLGQVPDGVDDASANVAISSGGLAKLLAGGKHAGDVDAFTDPAFSLGLAARSSLLGDPTDPSAEGNPANWVVGGPGSEPDVLLIIGADREEKGAKLFDDLRKSATESGLRLIYDERGHKLDAIGKEHFGFQDGVSQPGVRGRTAREPDSYITPRVIDPSYTPEAWLYGLPGQYLVWPGEFVFGYPGAGADPLVPGQINLPGPSWSRNGSYVVFRRLRQDVAGFWEFVTEYANGLSKRPGFEGISAEWLAARVVGRWPSGAPIARLPDGDDEKLGVDRLANNNFGFAAAAEAMPLAGGGTSNGWPEAGADPVGLTCPMSAHIRKVNARETPGDFGGRRASFNRRVLRRGLPYGKRLENPLGLDPEHGQRGFLFLCYQASIADQFEFLCNDWMNSPTNPRSPSGNDMLLGQNNVPTANPLVARQRSATVFGREAAAATVATGGDPRVDVPAVDDFVIPTGGGYFFSPSISALREVIAK